MSDRIACVVPFCRRTAARSEFGEGCTEIICGKHGRAASRVLRLRYRKLFRCWKRGNHDIRLMKILDRLWERYKASAVEAAAGIR